MPLCASLSLCVLVSLSAYIMSPRSLACVSVPPQLKEGLSALMQHPTFLAALVGHERSSPTAMSKAEAPLLRSPPLQQQPQSRTASSTSVAAAAAAAPATADARFSPETMMVVADEGENDPRKCVGTAAVGGGGGTVSGTVSGSVSVGTVSVGAVGGGVGGGGGGGGGSGCCSGRSQGRGDFVRRLPRSEEACA